MAYIDNIEKLSIRNDNFRKVLYTTKNLQLVVMSLKPGEEIGEEVHDVDQFFRIEKGAGQAVIDGQPSDMSDGTTIIVSAGAKHNIINSSDSEPLKLYTLYCPPHHQDGTMHATKAEAEGDDEHFDGKVSD